MLRLFLILSMMSVLSPMNRVVERDAESLSLADAVSWLEKEAHRIIRAMLHRRKTSHQMRQTKN